MFWLNGLHRLRCLNPLNDMGMTARDAVVRGREEVLSSELASAGQHLWECITYA